MLSLLCFHGPQGERCSLVSLVPSVQWGQPSLVVCWGRGAQGPRPWGRGGDWARPVGRACSCPAGVPLPRRGAASRSCFCFPRPRWNQRPASLPPRAPSPRTGGAEAGSSGSSPGLSSLPPALGVSHLWAQEKGRGAQKPGSSVTQHGCLCGPGQPGHLCWACVPMCPGQGPWACPPLQPRVL